MSVFNHFKKNESTTSCSCGCGCSESIATTIPECCGKPVKGVCCIKVLGAGCQSCHEQYKNVQEAVKHLGLSAAVEYVTDMKKVAGYGVMNLPAIVVNEKVVAIGRVYSIRETMNLISGKW